MLRYPTGFLSVVKQPVEEFESFLAEGQKALEALRAGKEFRHDYHPFRSVQYDKWTVLPRGKVLDLFCIWRSGGFGQSMFLVPHSFTPT